MLIPGIAPAGNAPRRSRARRLLRALPSALLLLALILAAAEGFLRLLPLARWEPQFAGARVYPIFVPGGGGDAGRYVTNEHYRGSLSNQSFSRVKTPGTFRIFVLGGSAALGYPYAAENGFSGI